MYYFVKVYLIVKTRNLVPDRVTDVISFTYI